MTLTESSSPRVLRHRHGLQEIFFYISRVAVTRIALPVTLHVCPFKQDGERYMASALARLLTPRSPEAKADSVLPGLGDGAVKTLVFKASHRGHPNDVIHLRQVEVYGFDGLNYALATNGALATQASLHEGKPGLGADKVIDGNLTTFNHTKHGSDSTTTITLLEAVRVERIVIHNVAWNDKWKNSERLEGATMRVLDEHGNALVVHTFSKSGEPRLFKGPDDGLSAARETRPDFQHDFTSPLPRYLAVSGAGEAQVNGVYKLTFEPSRLVRDVTKLARPYGWLKEGKEGARESTSFYFRDRCTEWWTSAPCWLLGSGGNMRYHSGGGGPVPANTMLARKTEPACASPSPRIEALSTGAYAAVCAHAESLRPSPPPPSTPFSLQSTPLSCGIGPLVKHGLAMQERKGYRAGTLSPEHSIELAMLHKLWASGGRAGRDNPYELVRVDAVETTGKPDQNAAFEFKIDQVEARRGGGSGSQFNASFDDPDGEKAAVLRQLKDRFSRTNALHRANLVLAFHGCLPAAAESICSNGFASISTRDNGYFGNGVYFTTSAQYACEYATGTIDGASAAADADGCFVLLACWVCPGLVYPLSRAVDYSPGVQDKGAHYSNFYQPPPAVPSALKPPFDAHYVCVQRSTYQCVDGVRDGLVADYDELIVKEGTQALPAFLLYFRQPGRNPRPIS